MDAWEGEIDYPYHGADFEWELREVGEYGG